MNTALVGNGLTGFLILFGEDIYNGQLGVSQHLSAFFGEIQHCLVGIVKGWPCHLVIFLRIRCIQTDGNTVDDLCQLRNDVALVIEISKPVGIQADRKSGFLFDIAGTGNQILQCAGRLAVSAEDELLVSGKIKRVNGSKNLLQCRFLRVP